MRRKENRAHTGARPINDPPAKAESALRVTQRADVDAREPHRPIRDSGRDWVSYGPVGRWVR